VDWVCGGWTSNGTLALRSESIIPFLLHEDHEDEEGHKRDEREHTSPQEKRPIVSESHGQCNPPNRTRPPCHFSSWLGSPRGPRGCHGSCERASPHSPTPVGSRSPASLRSLQDATISLRDSGRVCGKGAKVANFVRRFPPVVSLASPPRLCAFGAMSDSVELVLREQWCHSLSPLSPRTMDLLPSASSVTNKVRACKSFWSRMKLLAHSQSERVVTVSSVVVPCMRAKCPPSATHLVTAVYPLKLCVSNAQLRHLDIHLSSAG